MNARSLSRARGALAVVLALLVAACGAAVPPSPSPPPATPAATAAPAAATSAPSLTPVPTAAAPNPTAVASSAPSPGPTVTPAPSASAPVATPASGGTWVPAGTLASDWDVYDATAVPLRGGGVLILDMWGAGAQRWDPATNTWHEAAPLNADRSDFVMVTLRDGRVLVTGGLDQRDYPRLRAYSSTYVYDPATPAGTWTKVGLLGTARVAPAAAVLPDGRVLVAGGAYKDGPAYPEGSSGITLAAWTPAAPGRGTVDGPLDDVAPSNIGVALATAELFDPATGRWSSTGSMRYARVGAAAVTLADGRVLVVGPTSPEVESGHSEMDPRVFGTTEVYDPATGRFSLVGSLPPIDRAAFAAVGFDVPEVAGQWGSTMGTPIALPDGGALLVGQKDQWKHWGLVSRSFRFDSASGRWRQLGKASAHLFEPWPPTQREATQGLDLSDASAAALPDGLVLVAGGTVYDGAGAAVESQVARLYDPGTNKWWRLPSIPTVGNEWTAVALANGSVLVIGSTHAGEARAIRFVPSP